VALLNWRFGFTQTTLWRIELARFPDVSNERVATKPIITIPTSKHRDWNGDDAEEGGPKRWCDGPRVWGAQGRQRAMRV
jgi:hypothetical protein